MTRSFDKYDSFSRAYIQHPPSKLAAACASLPRDQELRLIIARDLVMMRCKETAACWRKGKDGHGFLRAYTNVIEVGVREDTVGRVKEDLVGSCREISCSAFYIHSLLFSFYSY